jgi:hypothetical protein
MFPEGIKNRPKSAKKTKVKQIFPKKRYFFRQNFIFEPDFTFFQKNRELFHKKTVQINIMPGGIKKLVNIGQKKQRYLLLGGKGASPPPRIPNSDFTQRFLQQNMFEKYNLSSQQYYNKAF